MSADKFFKKKRNDISSFLAKELIYDYLYGELDHERKEAIKKLVETDKETQAEVARLKKAQEYLEKLGQIKISRSFLSEVHQATSYFEVLLEKTRFYQWPQGVRWALESAVVAAVVVMVAVLVPWNKLTSLKLTHGPDIVLAELSKEYVSKEEETSEASIPETKETQFKDEGAAAPTSTTTTLKVKAPVVIATTTTTTTNAVVAADKKGQGYLYRGAINVTNVSAITPKLVEKIGTLGGRKAGEVELGWKKGSGSYFHFTMPESHYQELLSVFKEYGRLDIQREKHERVMPEGIIRLIITVDEKK